MRGSNAGAALLTLVLLVGCTDAADPDATEGGTPAAPTSPTSPAEPAEPGTTPGADRSDRREERRPGQDRPAAIAVPEEVSEEASDTTAGYLDAYGAVLADPGGDHSDLVAGAALEALRAQAEEYELSGWRLEGRPRVVSVEVYEREDDRLVVGACVDNAAVRVVDQSGDVVSDGAGTSLNILTLAREEGGWVVVESTFPSDPDC